MGDLHQLVPVVKKFIWKKSLLFNILFHFNKTIRISSFRKNKSSYSFSNVYGL